MIDVNKLLDLRFVIGVFFSIVGLLLIGHSLLASPGAQEGVNRWCGLVFLLFGAFMTLLSFKKEAHDEILEDPKD